MSRAMDRREFLQGVAAVGGGALLAGCGGGGGSDAGGTGGASSASRPPLSSEPGTLNIAEWPGYEAGGTKAQTYGMVAGTTYTKEFGANTIKYADLGNDDKILNQVRAGAQFDLIHPCVGYVRDWVEADLVEPFDTSLLPSFPNLFEEQVALGNVDGQQYWVPWDWGYSSILYRTDKVDPADAQSWDLFWNEKYKGKISMWDGGSTPFRIAGLLLGVDDIDNMSSDEIEEAKQLLIEQKPLNKFYWTSEYGNMQPAFKNGDIWITYAWPNDYKDMRDAGLEVDYMTPKEGKLAWVCGFVQGKGTENFRHNHEYVESFINHKAAVDLVNLYAYGASDSTVKKSEVKDQGLATKLQIGDPNALKESHLEKFIPNRAEYQRAWEEVKAA
jgi:spermidine/putrescine transport system substrate-binding protein